MTGAARFLRTVIQVLIAVAAVVPAFVVLMDQFGVHLDEVAIAATVAAATLFVTAVQNALEAQGFIKPLLAGSNGESELGDDYLDEYLAEHAEDGMVPMHVAKAMIERATREVYEQIEVNEA